MTKPCFQSELQVDIRRIVSHNGLKMGQEVYQKKQKKFLKEMDAHKLLKIKELDTDNLSKTFSVTNNTNEDLSYRVVIEKSDKSTLLTDYIKYQLSVDGTYIGPTWLNDTLWKKDKIYNELKVTKNNYILLDGTIKKYEIKNISLILWTDYEKTPNAMQNKQFLGTIKIYAWTKVK